MRVRIKAIKCKVKGKSFLGQEVTIKGWVRSNRNQKTFSFIDVNDGSTVEGLQVVVDSKFPNYTNLMNEFTTGASVVVTGVIVESQGQHQALEMQAKQLAVIGSCDPASYPLQKKRHSLEFLRTIGHLRARTNTIGAISRVRSRLAFAIHKFFQDLGFLYVTTPIITASDCEGAGEMFRVTTLNPEMPPKNAEGALDWSKDFFEKPAYLTVSGQLNGEIYACALSDIYTFGPTFRAENSNTSRHLAEFWMVEPEMAFADLKDVSENAESFLKTVVKDILENCQEEMAFFDEYISKGVIERLELLVKTPFERATYTYAVRILEKADKAFEYPVKWGSDLQSEHERYLAEEYFGKPVILTDYPKGVKPFYMRANEDEKTVANMDILVPKVGEIVGGSQREERYDVLLDKIRKSGLNEKDYWWYLELRKYGSQPHSGYGLGFERLLQFVTGAENIREVIPFPRYPGKADF